MAEHKSETTHLRALLAGAPIRFWVCPVREHGERRSERGMPVVTVTWVGDVAHCTAPDCDRTSVSVQPD